MEIPSSIKPPHIRFGPGGRLLKDTVVHSFCGSVDSLPLTVRYHKRRCTYTEFLFQLIPFADNPSNKTFDHNVALAKVIV